jgi:hydrophobic/amphiphilic exporter-1 (mainly G- bacteria), HAE1 family
MTTGVSAWAIRNPVVVSVIMLAFLYMGLTSFVSLPIKPLPDTSFPIVQVSIALPGAAPRDIQNQIVRPVEGAIAGVTGVKTIQTQITQGFAITYAEFAVGDNVQRALDDIRSAVDSIRLQLPAGTENPIIQRLDVDANAMVTYAVQDSSKSPTDLSKFANDVLGRRLLAVKGVSRVTRSGGANREVSMLLDTARMAALRVSISDVNTAFNAAAIDVPGGRSAVGDQEQAIRVLSSVNSAEALEALQINLGNGKTVKLGDIATIEDGEAEAGGFAKLNGQSVVALQISKTKSASEVQVNNGVVAEIENFQSEFPNLKLIRLASSVEETKASYDATREMLLEGMVLAAIVVGIFLWDWRATLIASVAMPLSLIPTFWVMNMLGFSLNIVSLLALTLVIGILVDDAIVEIENIAKRISLGQKPYDAALIGADEIGLAVVAVTFTIVAVFLPVSWLGGIVGQYFREFGITVSVAVMFSLFVARFITPVMAAYYLTEKAHHAPQRQLPKWYSAILTGALNHRLIALFVGLAVFGGSLFIASQLPTGFTPTPNASIVYGSIEAAPGTTVSQMSERAIEVSEILKSDPDVASVFITAGNSGTGAELGGEVRSATATVILKPRKERALTSQEWETQMLPKLGKLPDLRVSFFNSSGGADVQIILGGQNYALLSSTANALVAEMRMLPSLESVRLSVPPANADLVIRPKTALATELGISAQVIADTVRIATLGVEKTSLPKMVDGDSRIPIRMKLPNTDRASVSAIGELPMPTAAGETVPLSLVAEIYFEPGTARIDHFNRIPQISINASLKGVTLGEAMAKIQDLKTYKNLPSGIAPQEYGDAQYLNEMFKSFGAALATGILAMLAVLVLLFRTFWKPITILAALPLSIGGAFGGLWLVGFALDLPAMIGILTLMGLVAKNSILLVEYAIEREREGLAPREAIIEACCERARPIIMTTIAMVAGMIPTAIGTSEGSEFRQPMAIAIIGGLLTSTLLSLVLVPVIHLLIGALGTFLDRWIARLMLLPKPTTPSIS